MSLFLRSAREASLLSPWHGIPALTVPYAVYGNLYRAVRESITWKVPEKESGMLPMNGKLSTIANPLRPSLR